MNSIEQKFVKFVRSENLIDPNDKILVAFSGGADSTCLLHLLQKKSGLLKIKIGAAHINHLLRGDESDSDEKFCEDFCKNLGISFYSMRVNVRKESQTKSKTIEEAARDLRYKSLELIAIENGYNKIATAHNLNDNAETVIYNLIKGTGINGLAGIPIRREKIIRPLLNIDRNEILNYLKSNNLEFKIDSSNFDTVFRRNFLRHEVFPKLKEINPSFETAIFNNSRIVNDLKKYIDSETAELFRHFVHLTSGRIRISKELFDLQNDLFISETIKKALQHLITEDISLSDISKIIELNSKQVGTKEELKNKFTAVNDRDEIVIKRVKLNQIKLKIVKGDKVKFGEMEFGIEQVKPDFHLKKKAFNEEIISADNTGDSFILRNWKTGDYFYPLGMEGKKKVSDFLTDIKIPAEKKKERLVLTNRNNIVWVVGLRLDDRYKVTPNTKNAYRLWIR